ncbi:hypothetical protein PENSPDRAFT_693801 [Peniophora sp. CONT]|nr:hypothetical protein PENSPDRAFT_693801 [Peniophora sp. CONT]
MSNAARDAQKAGLSRDTDDRTTTASNVPDDGLPTSTPTSTTTPPSSGPVKDEAGSETPLSPTQAMFTIGGPSLRAWEQGQSSRSAKRTKLERTAPKIEHQGQGIADIAILKEELEKSSQARARSERALVEMRLKLDATRTELAILRGDAVTREKQLLDELLTCYRRIDALRSDTNVDKGRSIQKIISELLSTIDSKQQSEIHAAEKELDLEREKELASRLAQDVKRWRQASIIATLVLLTCMFLPILFPPQRFVRA